MRPGKTPCSGSTAATLPMMAAILPELCARISGVDPGLIRRLAERHRLASCDNSRSPAPYHQRHAQVWLLPVSHDEMATPARGHRR